MNAAQVTYTNLLPAGAVPVVVKTDSSGNIYVAGNAAPGSSTGAFVSKISSDGSTLRYNTFLGPGPEGSVSAGVKAMAVTPDGSVFVAHSFQFQPSACCSGGSTITKLNPSGVIVSSGPNISSATAPFFVSTFTDYILDMTSDLSGNLYATSDSTRLYSSSPGSLESSDTSGFIYKLDPSLTAIVWAIGGFGGSHIAVDSQENVYVVGSTTSTVPTTPNAFQKDSGFDKPGPPGCGTADGGLAFGTSIIPCPHQYVTAIDQSGSKLIYSTYVTGSFRDVPAGIAVSPDGNVYVAGTTHSFDFPVTGGVLEPTYSAQGKNTAFPGNPYFGKYANDPKGPPVSATGYVAALNSSGTGLVFSTFFGGSATDLITSIALDEVNQTIYLGGSATSPDLPGIEGAYRHCVPQSFIAWVAFDGSSLKKTVLVPPFSPFILKANGTAAFATGSSIGSVDFEAPDPAVACIANSTDLSITDVVSPGQLLTVYGNRLSSSAQSVSPVDNVLPSVFGGVQVEIGGVPAPLLYVSPDQVNLQVPFEISGESQTTFQFTATDAEGFPLSDSRSLTVVPSNPTVLQVPVSLGDCPGSYLGQTETFVLNADGTQNSCRNPAKLGSIVTLFLDGLGTTATAGSTGVLNLSNPDPLQLDISFTSTNTSPAPVLVSVAPFAGVISGFYRIQIQLPIALENSVGATLQIDGLTAAGPISIPVVP